VPPAPPWWRRCRRNPPRPGRQAARRIDQVRGRLAAAAETDAETEALLARLRAGEPAQPEPADTITRDGP
jgi:hypothetical protein